MSRRFVYVFWSCLAKKELICPEKDYTLILIGGLALRLIISDFIERQAIKTTGVIRTLARFFNGVLSV